MNDVFVDTVGLIAVWDTSDQWHSAADIAYRELLSRRCRLITTSFVLLECANAASRRPYRSRVDALRRLLKAESLIIDPSDEEYENAWSAYHRGTAGHAGVVDHISFLVMQRLRLTEAFTNDRHFDAAGFKSLF